MSCSHANSLVRQTGVYILVRQTGVYILAKLMSSLNHSWPDQFCLPLMFGCMCVQKVDAIVQARQQVYANLHKRRIELWQLTFWLHIGATNAKHWSGRVGNLLQFKWVKRCSAMFACANACPSLLQQLLLLIIVAAAMAGNSIAPAVPTLQ